MVGIKGNKYWEKRGEPGETKRRIRSLIESDPTISTSSLMELLGISGSAIQRHIAGMPDIERVRVSKSLTKCLGCSKEIRRKNKYGMCRSCYKLSHSLEFNCTECGKSNVVTGSLAHQRRKELKKNPDRNQFCNHSCAATFTFNEYWNKRKEAQ